MRKKYTMFGLKCVVKKFAPEETEGSAIIIMMIIINIYIKICIFFYYV